MAAVVIVMLQHELCRLDVFAHVDQVAEKLVLFREGHTCGLGYS